MIKFKYVQLLLLSFALNHSDVAHGYELASHGNLTNHGYEQSVLEDNSFLNEIGVENGTNPFGLIYYEISNSDVERVDSDSFEQSTGRMPAGVSSFSISGWLMRGAIREDDHVRRWFPCKINAPNPQYAGIVDRPRNHFYDPWTDSPLSISIFDVGETAPKWGLGSTEPFRIPQQEDVSRNNHYTLFDATEAMYRALTGHSSSGANTIKPNNMAPVNGDDQKIVRNAYWATTFRALGDAVHLMQDMAQPQHTRNDAHSSACSAWIQDFITGHSSVYERYIEARAANADFTIPGVGLVNVNPLNYDGYPVPEFDDYASFFSTQHLNSIDLAKGLADYSNRGFFSAGTNLGQNNYPSPDNNPGSYIQTIYNLDWQGNPLPNGHTIDLLQGNVTDSITGANDTVALTTASVWDEFLVKNSASPTYTLTKKNYDDMADLLIPRAVSYSAGFINFFFRGRVKPIRLTIQTNGQTQELHLALENHSSTGTKIYDLSSGRFDLFYKATDGFLKPMSILSGMTVTGTIIHGAQHQIVAILPQDVDLLEPRPFTVVYTGLVGQEPGIIGHRLSAEKFYVAYYDNWDFGTGYTVKLDLYGNTHATFPSGTTPLRTRNIAVVDGDRYVDDETATVYKNGSPFLYMPNVPNGLWVHSQNLYIAALSGGGSYGPVVDVYTHAGGYVTTLITTTPAVPFGTYQTISVNETHLCVVDDGEIAGTLFDINGNLVTELENHNTVGAVMACGSTANRHFLHVNVGGVGYVRVYDNAGAFLEEIELDASASYGFGMAVSDNYIVIPAFYSNSIYVIRRDRDGSGTESYVFEKVLNPAGPSIYPYDASIDLMRPAH